ncbi:MAG TPA: DUF4292 domain-containing protein [bacterium]|nr:DUF4292 domain-containing protein [bacterium]
MILFVRARFNILILLAALLVGCGSGQVFRFTPTEQNPQQIYKRISQDAATIASYQGTANLTIDTPDQSGRIKGEIEVKPYESAKIRIQHPFGGYLGTLEFKENYLIFLDPAGNVQYVGTTENTGIPGLPALFSGKQNIIVLLTGLLNIPENPLQSLTADSLQDNLQVLYYTSPELHQTYWYDSRVNKVVKYRELNLGTGVTTEIDLQNFIELEGINFPRSIKIIQPEEKRLLSIYYQDIQIARRKVQAYAR